MKYLSNRREFGFSIDDVVNNSEFNEATIAEKLGEAYQDIVEKDLSRMLMRVLFGSYTGTQPLKHRKFLVAYILNNPFAQVKLVDAFVELVKGAMYSGKDLVVYMQKTEQHYPHIPETVYQELQMGQLWVTGDKVGLFDYEFPSNDIDLEV